MTQETNAATGLTPDDIRALEAPLPLEHHEARAAGKNKAGDKQQWLIYITQEGIIPRLNSVDANWTWDVRESRETTRYAVVTGRLTIKGVYRDGTGGGSPNGSNSPMTEDTEKGAETDALKRAAMRFGVGLYLRSQPMIWVPITEKTWEDEKAALADFAKWYQRQFGANSRPTPTPPPTASLASTAPTSTSGGSRKAFEWPVVGNIDMPTLCQRAYDAKLVTGKTHFGNLIRKLYDAGDIRDALNADQVYAVIEKHQAEKQEA
ncbi:MAG: Rad52/Rad22 family DNA repair protein [Acidithiobacillus sp.]|nr:Rad52/Rad22 family DNA repair protein [Acidithiobacillus sp.]